jgi:hypothetical protein
VKPLTEDTVGDKVLRFVLGAVLGCAVAWFLALWSSLEMGSIGRLTVAAAILGGALAVLLGDAFFEGIIRGRWWNDWWD